MVTIRPAAESDVDALYSFDLVARRDDARREFIERSVAAGSCHVAEVGGEAIGYGVLSHNFYGHGFVEMLYVHPDRRRRVAGALLLLHMESLCRSPKLFTSTNLLNLPMQSLLNREGYTLSGVIHNLDEGDPGVRVFQASQAGPTGGLTEAYTRRPTTLTPRPSANILPRTLIDSR
jgi:GNAT superfamily N-acetyltransferase